MKRGRALTGCHDAVASDVCEPRWDIADDVLLAAKEFVAAQQPREVLALYRGQYKNLNITIYFPWL